MNISIIRLKEIHRSKGTNKREYKKFLLKFQNSKIQRKKKILKISRGKHSLHAYEWKPNSHEASYQQHWQLQVTDLLSLKF